MIYRRSCKIESEVKLDKIVSFKFGDFTIRLAINEKGILSTLHIDAHINIDDLDIPEKVIQPSGGQVKANFLLPDFKDKSLSEEYKNLIPYLEAYLFEFGIVSINSDITTLEIIAENELEKKQLDQPYIITKASLQSSKPPLVNIIKDWMDVNTIAGAYILRDLHIPFSFYRRAFIALEDDDFPVAFQAFYLILEGFYGDGRHENLDKIFIKHKELVDIVQSKLILNKEFSDAFEKFKVVKFTNDPEGVFKSLLIARHHMSHFSISETKRPYVTPSNRRDYKDITFALMSIVADVIDTNRVKLAKKHDIPIKKGSHFRSK